MNKCIYTLLIPIFFCSCSEGLKQKESGVTTEKIIKDTFDELERISNIPDLKIKNINKQLKEIEIDGCQYIIYYTETSRINSMMVHKGNCNNH